MGVRGSDLREIIRKVSKQKKRVPRKEWMGGGPYVHINKIHGNYCRYIVAASDRLGRKRKKRGRRLRLFGSRIALLPWHHLLQSHIVAVEFAFVVYDADTLHP